MPPTGEDLTTEEELLILLYRIENRLGDIRTALTVLVLASLLMFVFFIVHLAVG